MNEPDENSVVSSSSTSTSLENGEIPCSRGTPVLLQGKLLMEMDNALVLNVCWRRKNFAGTLIKVDDSNNWEPQRLQSCPPSTEKLKKTWKHFNSPGYKKNRGPRQRGIYSLKYPRSFVDSSNIVESKLRYGRDKRVAAYSSCPSSPKSPGSKSDASNNSLSHFTSSPMATRRCSSFSYEKPPNEFQNPQPSCSNYRKIGKRNKANHKSGDEETQCNEVDSSRLNYESMDEGGLKPGIGENEQNVIGMPSLERSDFGEQSSKKNLDLVKSFNLRKQDDLKMPSLVSIKIAADGKHGREGSCASDTSSTKIIDDNLLEVGDEQSTMYQSAAMHPKTRNFSFYDEVCELSKPQLSASDSDSEKTYATLENCDFNFLSLASSVGNQKEIYNPEEGGFLYSPKIVEETQNKACPEKNAKNSVIFQNADLIPTVELAAAGYGQTETEPMLDIKET